MKPCHCASCKFTAKVARIQAKLSKRDRAVIEELLLKWADAGMNSVYWEMQAKGTWPT